MSGKFTKLSEDVVLSAMARAEAGEFVTDIAAELGVASMTLYKHFKRRRGKGIGRHKRAVSLSIPTLDTDLAYLAGIIDGEGTIACKASGLWYVSITNTDVGLIEWLSTIGGGVYNRQRFCPVNTDTLAKPSGDWHVQNAIDVLALLVAVSPYLRIKRAKADQAINDLRARLGSV